ncbi:ATP-binding cassette sub-family G member 4-like isoform X2 [Adelges cooleyi]|nr:ATP-binding cassette sub-family G member 4-like isoform X2 [Adelges cooleyi]
MQDDMLQPLLTVQESMEFVVRLVHSCAEIDDRKRILIKEILNNLTLYETRHTMEKNLSGGERKRLSIALELISNPKAMFLDEPTTGLDVVSTNQVVSAMRCLADSDKTIVCTIHQLSASNLALFDSLYVLTTTGQCMYNGTPSRLIDHLKSFGLHCPLYHNPADYVIDVSRGSFGNDVDVLVENARNGGNEILPDDKGKQESIIRLEKMQKYTEFPVETHPVNYTAQFSVLIQRLLLIATRDKFLVNARFLVHMFLACAFGLSYYGIGQKLSHSLDNIAMLYFTLIQVVYTSVYTLAMKLPMDLFIVRREYFSRWYSLGPYYVCITLLDLPVQVLSITIYTVLIYALTGQPQEYFRFWMFLLMFNVTTLFSQSFGMFISVLFDNFIIIIVVINILLLPWVMFSGVFLRIRDTSEVYRWLYDYSFLKRSMQGIFHSVYGFDRPFSPCTEEYCHYRSPLAVLKDVDMAEDSYWANITYIVVLYLIMKISTYAILKYRLLKNK